MMDQLTAREDAIAARLSMVVRDIDALGRIGGDEFVVLTEAVSDATDVALIAERLKEALKAPFVLADSAHAGLTVTASIGAVTGERASVEDLLRDADIAMHRAKWDGKNRHVVFDVGMQDVVQSRMELEMALHTTGFEALIRWTRPSRGVVQPIDFVPSLEETGMIVEVGKWVLGQACREGAKWRQSGHTVGIAVNVSARQLETDQFITDVGDALRDSGLQANALTLEITETTLMRDHEQTARRLRAIKQLGVRTLVKLGKALCMETVAEGIERQYELSLLQDEQCNSGQGYLFARPLSVADAQAFLVNWSASEIAQINSNQPADTPPSCEPRRSHGELAGASHGYALPLMLNPAPPALRLG